MDKFIPEDEIRKQVVKIEAEMKEKEERDTISHLKEEITRNRLGVWG